MPSTTSREMALSTGEIHSMRPPVDGRLIDRLDRKGLIIDTFGPEINWWFHMNTEVPPLNDIRVRKAISYAIDRKEIQAFIGLKLSDIADALIAPTYFGAAKREELPAEAPLEYNPDKARKLLAEAGYPNGFKLSMIITKRDDYRQQMIIIQEHLKKVGIEVELNQVDHTHYHSQIVKKVNPLVLFGDIAYPNSEIFLVRFFKSKVPRNFANWNNPEFDALMEKVAKSPTFDERRKLLIEAQRMVASEFLFVPTNFCKAVLVRSPKIDLGYDLRSSLALNYRYLHVSQIKD